MHCTSLQNADPEDLVPLLRDKMLAWWAIHSLLPAAVLGVRGREIARKRRWAVNVFHNDSKVGFARRVFRRTMVLVIKMQGWRRAVLLARGRALLAARLEAICSKPLISLSLDDLREKITLARKANVHM